MERRLLTVKEAGARLRISKATLYKIIKSGEIKPVKIGKRTLFTEEELNRFIDKKMSDGD